MHASFENEENKCIFELFVKINGEMLLLIQNFIKIIN